MILFTVIRLIVIVLQTVKITDLLSDVGISADNCEAKESSSAPSKRRRARYSVNGSYNG